jgi:hypothetical protein
MERFWMDAVYRVLGSNLGNGACLLAESESEAIEIVADVFELDEKDLTAGLDGTVSLPTRGVILNGDGTTTDYSED